MHRYRDEYPKYHWTSVGDWSTWAHIPIYTSNMSFIIIMEKRSPMIARLRTKYIHYIQDNIKILQQNSCTLCSRRIVTHLRKIKWNSNSKNVKSWIWICKMEHFHNKREIKTRICTFVEWRICYSWKHKNGNWLIARGPRNIYVTQIKTKIFNRNSM